MGTSTSSKGPGAGSPLVPPWADTDNSGGGPPPEPHRFREFRRSLGKFVSGGALSDLQTSLGSYAKSATGGSAVGPRRFGSMARAGGGLFDAISNGKRVDAALNLKLAELNGLPTDVAIDKIVQMLVPDDGDADRIRVALNEALADCLDGYEDFDFNNFSDEMVVQVMLAYVTQCVFGQIVLDSRDAFAKASSAARSEQAERELHALVAACVDVHMRRLLAGSLGTLDQRQIEEAQLHAIRDVWIEWEGYIS